MTPSFRSLVIDRLKLLGAAILACVVVAGIILVEISSRAFPWPTMAALVGWQVVNGVSWYRASRRKGLSFWTSAPLRPEQDGRPDGPPEAGTPEARHLSEER